MFVAFNVSIHRNQKVYLPEEATTKVDASFALIAFTSVCKMVYNFFFSSNYCYCRKLI